jgi:hypothetical protein
VAYCDEAQSANVSKELYLKRNAQLMQGAALGVQETELSSLLNTLSQQAYEIRAAAGNILARVYPQPTEDCAEKQVFGSGYVGSAEQIRSVQREAIDLLQQLAKLV